MAVNNVGSNDFDEVKKNLNLQESSEAPSKDKLQQEADALIQRKVEVVSALDSFSSMCQGMFHTMSTTDLFHNVLPGMKEQLTDILKAVPGFTTEEALGELIDSFPDKQLSKENKALIKVILNDELGIGSEGVHLKKGSSEMLELTDGERKIATAYLEEGKEKEREKEVLEVLVNFGDLCKNTLGNLTTTDLMYDIIPAYKEDLNAILEELPSYSSLSDLDEVMKKLDDLNVSDLEKALVKSLATEALIPTDSGLQLSKDKNVASRMSDSEKMLVEKFLKDSYSNMPDLG